MDELGVQLSLVGAGAPRLVEAGLFEELVGGWRRQQQARRLGSIIEDRERVVRAFAAFTCAWPWEWTEAQVEAWVAGGGWAHSTVRSYQSAVGMFLGYALDPRYGWAAVCEQRVGAVPHQICHEWNTVVHVADSEGRADRRPASRGELRRLFATIDAEVDRRGRVGHKGWLPAFRDAALFKSIYGWGLRRREAAMLDVVDFGPNPAAPRLGNLGVVQVRYGKAQRGSPPKRRTVATVMPWSAEVVEQYLVGVRPRYGVDHPAVWLTERGGRISVGQIDERFRLWRDAAGLPGELSVHCLRHSFVSHQIEDGVDPLFVQQQVGHSWGSTTATYTTVGADARQRMLSAALARAFDDDGGQGDQG